MMDSVRVPDSDCSGDSIGSDSGEAGVVVEDVRATVTEITRDAIRQSLEDMTSAVPTVDSDTNALFKQFKFTMPGTTPSATGVDTVDTQPSQGTVVTEKNVANKR